MIRYPNLIPECNVDTVFVEMLGYVEPNHAPDINQVCFILDKKKPNEKAIGFIDNDKKKPKYLLNFKLKDGIKNVQLLEHSSKKQYLIVVNPAMDRFIYNLCSNLEIDLSKYKLPRDFQNFLLYTKKEFIKRDNNFKNLLNTIKQKNPAEILRIKSWIEKYS